MLIQGPARAMVNHAIEGALERLSRPKCLQLFTDLIARDGRPLADRLAERGKTPGEYLADLYFVDGDQTRQCLADDVTTAFTAPFYNVIFVCTSRFRRVFATNAWYTEVVVIHELLHATGLGENPPTSSWITHTVFSHCRP